MFGLCLARLGLLDDFFGRGLRALDVALEFAGLRDPAIDVGCGFARNLTDFVL
jgi:hypothetical protein